MMFKSAVIASFVASATAASFVPSGGIEADSEIGQRLLSKARAVEQANDQTWMTGFKIKYLGCSSLVQVNQGGDNGGNEDATSILYTQNLVKFGLCKQETSCSSCGNGVAQYVVPMGDFVDAWTESKMNQQEQACENVRENCNCENANDDEACESLCYSNAGMSSCDQYEGEQQFDVEDFMECDQMEAADGNNNNNNNNNNNYGNNNYNTNGIDMSHQYYTGLYCASNGMSINTAVFMDSGCTTLAKSGTYAAFNYGASLPYAGKSLVDPTECMSCMDNNNGNGNNNNNNNGNNGNNAQVTEMCQEMYQESAKCETNLQTGSSYFYPDTSGCTYINSILPKLARATSSVSSAAAVPIGGSASVAFAIIFFLSSLILGAYSFFLYRKIHRAKVNLAHSEGMMMA